MAEPSDSSSSSEDDEYSDSLEVAASAGARFVWFYTTYTRVCQRNFIYLISILAKFVLFEYSHVVIVIESQYTESDFYDLGWEILSLTILMSQYDIIMYIISMQSEIYFIKSLFKLLINLLH